MTFFKTMLRKKDWMTIYQCPIRKDYDKLNNIFKYYLNLLFPCIIKQSALEKRLNKKKIKRLK